MLRQAQKQSLLQMLNFNQPVERRSAGDDAFVPGGSQQFKVLVYDAVASDVVSPALSVQALRDAGVTLHMPLASKREQIADVPAVYRDVGGAGPFATIQAAIDSASAPLTVVRVAPEQPAQGEGQADGAQRQDPSGLPSVPTHRRTLAISCSG